jgi:hypothetical protein
MLQLVRDLTLKLDDLAENRGRDDYKNKNHTEGALAVLRLRRSITGFSGQSLKA